MDESREGVVATAFAAAAVSSTASLSSMWCADVLSFFDFLDFFEGVLVTTSVLSLDFLEGVVATTSLSSFSGADVFFSFFDFFDFDFLEGRLFACFLSLAEADVDADAKSRSRSASETDVDNES